MRTERALRGVAIGCAIVLLLGPFADRTSWGRGAPTIYDSAGYNYAAFFSGVVALVALAVALSVRHHMAISVLSFLMAVAAFGLTAYVCGTYWLALSRGEALIDGTLVMPARLTMYPASAPPFFALAASVGAVSAFALLVDWLRQPKTA